MFRNILAAALRNLARGKLHAAISILGLSIGITAALLIGLMIRGQLTFEHFIPGHRQIYLFSTKTTVSGRPAHFGVNTHPAFAALLKLKFPQVQATTRLFSGDHVRLRHGDVEAVEKIAWADVNFFAVMPLPVYAGDLKHALARPGNLVLTQAMARKYFGRDDVVGQSLEVITDPEPALLGLGAGSAPPPLLPGGTHPMIVAAVIRDLPVNGTDIDTGIFISGLAPFSTSARLAGTAIGANGIVMYNLGETFVQLAPGASPDPLQAALPTFLADNIPRNALQTNEARLIRLDQMHLFPDFNPGIHGLLNVAALTAALILFIAASNFVNLSTARSARRALEVGIRKVSGAGKPALIIQFLGESLVLVLIAAAIAVALSEILLPYVNAVLQSGGAFDYWRDPALAVAILLGTLALGISAGLYPAFVLSAFRPAAVLKGQGLFTGGSNRLRRVLVTAQFAILITLCIAAITVFRQRDYATSDALRVDTGQMLVLRGLDRIGAPCKDALMNNLRALPGVRGAYCGNLLSGYNVITMLRLKNGSTLPAEVIGAQPGLLELYGIKPIAGRLFRPDAAPAERTMLVNETAVRRLGFASPAAAVGQTLSFAMNAPPRQIIGVVPDFMLNAGRNGASLAQAIGPVIYTDSPESFRAINLKLTGRDVPVTLAAIDRDWAAAANGLADRFFVQAYIQNLYLSMLRQAQALAIFCGIAVFLAALGLMGLAISTAERRTKEIGIRKAMGAATPDVVRLLTWEFARPVLWANLIAWPIAYYAMNVWLNGFAYRITLSLWTFAAAGALALAIALATVSLQSFIAARAKPVSALRYE